MASFDRIFAPFYIHTVSGAFLMKKVVCRIASVLTFLVTTLFLSGCDLAVFDTASPVAQEMGDTILLTAGIMLIVVIPTLFLSIWVPYKYRKNSANEDYDPNWDHSTKIEWVVWGIPTLLIVVLAVITVYQTYKLDPREPIESDKAPMTIQVVSLDWKWLFIYPEEEIAVVNEVAFPVDQPVEFLITSETTMNSLFIPRVSGQLYAMAGMENRMNVIADKEGVFPSMSANYSGHGFTGMKFNAHVGSDADFAQWVAKVKASGDVLDKATYEALLEQSTSHPVEYFSSVNPLMFKNIIEKYTGVQNGR